MENKIKIIVADDHPLFSQGLLYVLGKKDNIQVIGQATDGNTALDLIKNLKPDIAILDVQMPSLDGFELAKIVIKEKLPTKIIFLTMFSEEIFVKKVIEIGIKGFVLKENAVEDIVKCVEAVSEGKFFLSPQVSAMLLEKEYKKGNSDLTVSEKKIFYLVSKMKSSKEIAEELYISVKTVENHRSNICKKLGITGNSALLKYALQRGL